MEPTENNKIIQLINSNDNPKVTFILRAKTNISIGEHIPVTMWFDDEINYYVNWGKDLISKLKKPYSYLLRLF